MKVTLIKKVYLAKKGDKVINHTDLTAMEHLDGIRVPELTVTIEEWEAAGSTAHIDTYGTIVLGAPQAPQDPEDVVARREEIAALLIRESILLTELASKDYKVIKASEIGEVLAETDPELHFRRKWCRNRVNEIRDRLTELNAETT